MLLLRPNPKTKCLQGKNTIYINIYICIALYCRMLYRSTGLECSPNHIPFCLLTEIVVELPKCWKIRLPLSHLYLRCKERKEGSHLLDVCFRVSQTDNFRNGGIESFHGFMYCTRNIVDVLFISDSHPYFVQAHRWQTSSSQSSRRLL